MIEGFYGDLRQNLIDYDANDGHGFGAGALGFATGLEIEAITRDPAQEGSALLTFRGLEVEGQALLLPVTNFADLLAGTATAGGASFGPPVLLGLASSELRSIECSEGGCLLLGGAAGGNDANFRLFTWSGGPTDTVEFRAAELSDLAGGGNFEGIVEIPTDDFTGSAGDSLGVQLILDTGTFDYYGDGNEAKDLPEANWRKFRSVQVTLGPVVAAPVAEVGDVVINEFMANPAGADDSVGEWFELFNATEDTIDLNGWVIADADTDNHRIVSDSALLLAPGAFIVLGNSEDTTVNGGVEVAYQYDRFAFGNSDSGDEFLLFAPDGVLVDSLSYGEGTDFPLPNGASVSLRDPGFDNGQGSNWCVATTAYGAGDFGTPGTANDCLSENGFRLVVTEIWPGQAGDDLTSDWFEITNTSDTDWLATTDGMLFYDDESREARDAVPILGIDQIAPGESVVVLVTNDSTDLTAFQTVWGEVVNLENVQIGITDGAGLGGGGDAVTLWTRDPALRQQCQTISFPIHWSPFFYYRRVVDISTRSHRSCAKSENPRARDVGKPIDLFGTPTPHCSSMNSRTAPRAKATTSLQCTVKSPAKQVIPPGPDSYQ